MGRCVSHRIIFGRVLRLSMLASVILHYLMIQVQLRLIFMPTKNVVLIFSFLPTSKAKFLIKMKSITLLLVAITAPLATPTHYDPQGDPLVVKLTFHKGGRGNTWIQYINPDGQQYFLRKETSKNSCLYKN